MDADACSVPRLVCVLGCRDLVNGSAVFLVRLHVLYEALCVHYCISTLCIRILTVLSMALFAVGFVLDACYAAGGTKALRAEGKVPLSCSRLRHV